MSKELTTKNEIALTGGQKLQVQLMAELEKASEDMGVEMTVYGKKCAVNAIGGLVSYCKTNGIGLNQLDPTLLRLSLQNIGYTELNYAAIPSEVYFDIRKNTKANDGTYIAIIKAQGAGNEKLVRKYGVGIKKDTGLHTPWLVREGDEFILPSYDGLKITPPIYKPKIESMNKKVILVVYPLEKADGSTEYLMATRDSVKANIIAQIRQNTLYAKMTDADKEALYNKLNKDAEEMDVDSFIDKYFSHISMAYTSGGSKEQMILRKMKNNALKPYPKEYDNSAIRDAVESMFEDYDETLKVEPAAVRDVDVVEKVEKEIHDEPTGDAIPDFDVETAKPVKEKVANSDDETSYEDIY